MANLFDYLAWRGDLTFDQSPFNELDALAFTQIAYVNLDGIVPESFKERKTIKEIVKEFKALPDYTQRLKMGYLINDKTPEFLFKCAESPRYKDVEICGYSNIFDKKEIEQFAAMTFVANRKCLIAYRGTDDSVLGFEEDFRIAYIDQIPSQRDSLKYYENAAAAFPFSDFIFAGHSKGGNLALYTAVNTSRKLRKKIHSIYNFDGPGFSTEFYNREEYKEIKERLYSYYPKFSVVGMLFHHPKKYEVIDSSSFAIMQHDAMSWQTSGNGFVNMDDFTDECKIFYNAFNNWIDKISLEEREDFVNSLFFLIKSSGYEYNLDIMDNVIQSATRIITAYTKMDKIKRDDFKDVFVLLLNAVKSELPIFKLGNILPKQLLSK